MKYKLTGALKRGAERRERRIREERRRRQESRLRQIMPMVTRRQPTGVNYRRYVHLNREGQFQQVLPDIASYQDGEEPIILTSEYKQGKLEAFYNKLPQEEEENDAYHEGYGSNIFFVYEYGIINPVMSIRGNEFEYNRNNEGCEILSATNTNPNRILNTNNSPSFEIRYCPNRSPDKYFLRITTEQTIDENISDRSHMVSNDEDFDYIRLTDF